MQTRREFMAKVAAAAVGFAAGPGLGAEAKKRPNIIYIMSDDHAAAAIGAYGGRLAAIDPTPVIDKFAGEGMRFENCFVTNSICVPSRACVMTGQYNHVNGCYTLNEPLAGDRQYLAIEMRKAGYQTAMIGKWHLQHDPNFDYYCVLPGQGKYHDPIMYSNAGGTLQKVRFFSKLTREIPVRQFTGHSTDVITDVALEYLKERRDDSKPLFMMLHFKAPHDMFENAERYDSYLEDVDIPEPASLWSQPGFGSIATRGHENELLGHIGTSIGRRHLRRNYTRNWANDESLTDEQAKRLSYQTYMKKYLRCVKGVDDNLKRFFDYLKAAGLYDNTVIIYTGDQGMMFGEHDYQDKRWMYEPSLRMPLLVHYGKSIKAGSRSDAIIENIDFAPLMLDFAGVETPSYMQGRSFRGICESGREPAKWKKAAYYRYWMHMAHHWNPAHFGVRTKTHKLIFYYGCDMEGKNQTPPAWELYDLVKDPHEVNNVYDDAAYAGVGRELKKQLRDMRIENGDTDEKFPAIRKVVDEFWEYDEKARARAIEISHEYLESHGGNAAPGGKSVKARVLPGGWIVAASSEAPLKTLNGAKEVSRNATYRISKIGPASFNTDNAYLLSGDAPPVKGHAFHSDDNARDPYVVVKLEKSTAVDWIRIVNRTTGLEERAEGLTVWTSTDDKKYEKLWQAEKVAAAWDIDAGGRKCQYVKVGLTRRGTLHLNKVIVFAK